MDGAPAQQVLVLTDEPANYSRTYTGYEATMSIRGRAMAKRLAERREYAIDHLLNRRVDSAQDQDALDIERQQWNGQVVAMLQEVEADASDISRVRRLGTYTPRNLQSLVKGEAPDKELLKRNLKHRNEMAERLDRLLEAIKNLERR